MSNEHTSSPYRKRLVPRKAAFAALNVGNTKGHELINRGAITAVKLDGKTLIDMDSVDRFIESLYKSTRPA